MRNPENQGKPWTHELKQELVKLYAEGVILEDMCYHFKRTGSAIVGQLQTLGLLTQDLRPMAQDQWCLLDEVRRMDRMMRM